MRKPRHPTGSGVLILELTRSRGQRRWVHHEHNLRTDEISSPICRPNSNSWPLSANLAQRRDMHGIELRRHVRSSSVTNRLGQAKAEPTAGCSSYLPISDLSPSCRFLFAALAQDPSRSHCLSFARVRAPRPSSGSPRRHLRRRAFKWLQRQAIGS